MLQSPRQSFSLLIFHQDGRLGLKSASFRLGSIPRGLQSSTIQSLPWKIEKLKKKCAHLQSSYASKQIMRYNKSLSILSLFAPIQKFFYIYCYISRNYSSVNNLLLVPMFFANEIIYLITIFDQKSFDFYFISIGI